MVDRSRARPEHVFVHEREGRPPFIVRGGNRFTPEGQRGAGGRGGDPAARRASMGHISFGLAGFDYVAVKAELEQRGLTARVDTGGRGDISTAAFKSYHTTTPNGWDLQISNRVSRDGGGGGWHHD